MEPLVTVAVPSFNQGRYLEEAIISILQQEVPVEIFVLDGGSSDNSIEIIKKWENKLAGWRSHSDAGQASAINEGILQGRAPYVCWLNSDDMFLPSGLSVLVDCLQKYSEVPAVYGRAWNFQQISGKRKPVWVEPFSLRRLAFRCIVSQPATLIRRTVWEQVGGVDENYYMSFDYDLWWRISKTAGPMKFIENYVALNRVHQNTKTKTFRKKHYQESMSVVKKHHGRVPLKWWISQPYTVWMRTLMGW